MEVRRSSAVWHLNSIRDSFAPANPAGSFRSTIAASMFAAMKHDTYRDEDIRGILNTVKTIAMVGISPKENRPSYFAFKYLLERGYRMIPINPGLAGKNILGQKAYAKLSDVPERLDMVDIFRASAKVLPIVEEALALNPKPQVIWMQLNVRNDEAALAGGTSWCQSRDEPLSEDRIWPPVFGDFMDWRQFTDAFFKTRTKSWHRGSTHGAWPHV